MRKTIYYCDRCGRPVTDTVFQIGFRTIDAQTGDQIEEEFNAEFCLDCYKEVDDAAAVAVMSYKKKPETDPEPKPVAPKPKRQAPNKAKIDMGKVHALLDAGWTYDKIGEEFSVSGQTISNWLKREKEETT